MTPSSGHGSVDFVGKRIAVFFLNFQSLQLLAFTVFCVDFKKKRYTEVDL